MTDRSLLVLVAEAYGGYGGIAQSTQDLLNGIETTGYYSQLHVIPRLKNDESLSPATVTQYEPSFSKSIYAIKAFLIAVKIRPDTIYCGHLFMLPLAAVLAVLFHARLIAHLHGIEVWDSIPKLQKTALKKCDVVFCVSSYTKERLIEHLPITESTAEVIYNQVGEQFVPQDRNKARQFYDLKNEKVILTVSRLNSEQRHKGHELVIQEVARLRKKGHNLVYIVAGDGDDQERLELLADTAGIGDVTRFLGKVADDELPRLFNAADIYAMPSRGEGFGIAFIEAMACGTLAIGLSEGGAPDALAAGVAVRLGEFPSAFESLVESNSIDRVALSRQVTDAFGTKAYRQRLEKALKIKGGANT